MKLAQVQFSSCRKNLEESAHAQFVWIRLYLNTHQQLCGQYSTYWLAHLSVLACMADTVSVIQPHAHLLLLRQKGPSV